MLTLYLLRHAKSSWSSGTLDDHARPLNQRGERAAVAMADHLRGTSIDKIVCSTSVRTRATIQPISQAVNLSQPTIFSHNLYGGSVADYLEICGSTEDHGRSLMLVGHNPTTEELLGHLVSEDPGNLMTKVRAKYPTGTLAEISFAVQSWPQIEPGAGTLQRLVLPRELVTRAEL